MYVMAIGIDRYKSWPRLYNAVSDATGALTAFKRLGFEEFRPPLLDEAATGQAIHSLVTDDLRSLQTSDSLVLFFAGHGATDRKPFDDGTFAKHGYIVPVDGAEGKLSTWVTLKSWLTDISALPAKHILVILDACHSGIALDAVIRTRGAIRLTESMEQLRARRSRRIITSALDDQKALDGGPVNGHSLFTGCLIEALDGAMTTSANRAVVTGSELGMYIQRRVSDYSPTNSQTPDFGALEHDNRGELIFEVSRGRIPEASKPPGGGKASKWSVTAPGRIWPKGMSDAAIKQASATPRNAPVGAAAMYPKKRPATEPPIVAKPEKASEPPPPKPAIDTNEPGTVQPPVHRPPVFPPPANEPTKPKLTPPLNSAFVTALDRHQKARVGGQSGDRVISVVVADTTTSIRAWATWAAWNGSLTLVSQKTDLDEAVAEVLAHIPWLRILPAARARFAQAAGISVPEVDTALRTLGHEERAAWIREVARTDLRIHVSGWLCTEFRGTWAHLPNFGAAPVQGTELLAALAALGAPITVLFHDARPSEEWLSRALQCAYDLAAYMPKQPLAVGVTDALARDARAALRPALQTILVDGQAPVGTSLSRVRPDARARTVETLLQALREHPVTGSLFAANTNVHTHEGPVDVDLYAAESLLAVQVDDWYHNHDPQAYHRARSQDISLQRAGTFVTRFLAEDVEHYLERVVKEIATDVSVRHAVVPSTEKSP